ncbi:MAG TPA: NAD(P)H-hydrate dehydratase, partial [bacterium]|nr:NAD(P)H-hydrate dehydratase [bacterium]
TVASAQPTVAGFQREPMTVALSETPDGVIAPQALRELLPWLEWATTVALGPGLTTKPAARAFVPALLDHWEGPLVLDADGLKIAGAHLDRLAERATPVVCTPHLGEASTLLQIPKEEIQRRRLETVLEAAAQQHLVLLLKGYRPITADPEGRASICVVGNPGLGTAGTGDVLTGIIGALLAQGLGPYDAARVGAYLHGTAGDLAAEARGQISMVAGDVVDHLPGAIQGAIAAH